MTMKGNNGFTLIELMIVVAIISILSAVAIPAYGNYVKRGKIAEATSTLSSLRVSMEQYYQDNRTYANGANCGVTPPVSPAVKYFTYTCVNADANSYVITATGDSSAGMAGFTYKVDQQNNKSSTITASGWTGNATCWATNSGGTC
jgi:type IV pilus assembly protein PilE